MVPGLLFETILADKKSKERSSSVGQKKDKKVMELKATMKMYHDELEEAVSFSFESWLHKRWRSSRCLVLVPGAAQGRQLKKFNSIFRMHFIIRKMKNGNQPLYLR